MSKNQPYSHCFQLRTLCLWLKRPYFIHEDVKFYFPNWIFGVEKHGEIDFIHENTKTFIIELINFARNWKTLICENML